MAYGELKVDSITFTNGGSDTTVSVSGLVQNPTFSGDITVTGTISGDVILGGTTVSGATVTGTAGQFGTVTGNTAGFITVTGTTVTGSTANLVSGTFTTQVSGATVTGNLAQFTTLTGVTAGFTTVTGTTVTGSTASFTSGVFTNINMSGAIALSNSNLTTIKTATFNSQVDLVGTSGSIAIDWSAAQNYRQPEPDGTITYTFTDPPGPCHLQLFIDSDGSSTAQTINWPGSVTFLGSSWSGENNKKAVINFWYDGTNYLAIGTNEA